MTGPRRRAPVTVAGRARAVALGLALAAVLAGCGHDDPSSACRDDTHGTRAEDAHCRDGDQGYDWVWYDPGGRVPAVGEPAGPARTTPPAGTSSAARRGGVAPQGGVSGEDATGSGSSSSRGGYVPMPIEPEEPEDEGGDDD